MKPSALVLITLAATTALADGSITDVPGIKVGSVTLTEKPTGCTVILAEGPPTGAGVIQGATPGVSQRGGAPGTRETDLMDPVNMVDKVNAIVLSGGSAYGLDAASGTMKWLEEKGIGWPVGPAGVVPIVGSAILFDLPFDGKPKIRPGADCGYKAAAAASSQPVVMGTVGAGAGATVGKSGGQGRRPMKGGLGSASIKMPNGLVVGAIVAVNSVGDIIDPYTGKVVAGAINPDDTFADARILMRTGANLQRGRPGENTTIGLVATNAKLTKAQVTKVAQMADDGFARAINPAHTAGDGDTIFALATGHFEGDVNASMIGALAAEAMADALLAAVREATSAGGVKAVRDLKPPAGR
ncbi:MAG TPA: P1 family peptidase [Vicinamibacteria bacterium]|nr:P1 family peptidase [Vicinamibacteria bacterium]